jgi:hypothetical protein
VSEKQEKVWIVTRRRVGWGEAKPMKAFDDRKDARDYAKRMNIKSNVYAYSVVGVKKG